jgi:hypothetical protein
VSAVEPGVWVFNGYGGQFPSGVFTTIETAEEWIAKYLLSGVLTWYPLDVGVYDWTIANKCFLPRKDHQREPRFIQSFSSAHTGHYHYTDGTKDSAEPDREPEPTAN